MPIRTDNIGMTTDQQEGYLKLDQINNSQQVLGELQAGQFHANGYGTYDYYGNGNGYLAGAYEINQVFTNGAPIGQAEPTLTYDGNGVLTLIEYPSGATKAFAYNGDGTLDTITFTCTMFTCWVKTFHYTAGVLTSITRVDI